MAFSHKIQGGESVPEHEQEKVHKQRLNELGNNITRAQETLQTLTATEEQVSVAKENLAVVNSELDQKSKELSVLNGKVYEAQSMLESLFKQQAEFSDISGKIEAAKKEEADLLKHIDELRIKVADLKQALSGIRDISVKEDQDYRIACENHYNNLAAFKGVEVTHELKVQEFNKTISDLETKISELQKQTEDQKILLMQGHASLQDLLKANDEAKAAGLKQTSDLAEKLAEMKKEKDKDWEQKDGELSRRWQILDEKTTQLREVKAGLEAHFNKTININI